MLGTQEVPLSDRSFVTRGGGFAPEVDLRGCVTDPIHRTAEIQPHGTFLEIDPGDGRVRSAAVNLVSFTDRSLDDVLGSPVDAVLGDEVSETAERWIGRREGGDRPGTARGSERLVVGGDADRLLVTLFPVGASCGLEIEPIPTSADGSDPDRVLLESTPLLERIRNAGSRGEAFAECVRAVRRVSGFDRVMLIRFDDEGHGEVVAEDRRDELGSYLGQRFPASDVPEPARRLYRRNRVRNIPDVRADPVPILRGVRTDEDPGLDLTHATLRGVPEIHRRYLRNMGVEASLSVSVLVDGRLWGLIACHATAPHLLGWAHRTVCELIGHTVAERITRADARARERRVEAIDRLEERLGSRLEALEAAGTEPTDFTGALVDGLREARGDLFSLLAASGLHLRLGDRDAWIAADGSEAPPEGLGVGSGEGLSGRIAESLRGRRAVAVRSVAGELDEGWPHSSRASGYLAVRLGRSGRSWCAWIRPEQRERIEWGGDPRRPAYLDPENGLTPRDSFEAWTQIVAERCEAWTELDRFAARRFAHLVDELFVELQARELTRINRALQARNEELESARRARERALARQKELLEKMEELARTDELTGLANRRALMRRLREEIERSRRYGVDLSLALLDLDRFKEVNDRYGHQTGDRVLEAYARLLEASTRAADVVGRHGGEEFALLLPETDLERARELAGRVLEEARRLTFRSESGADAEGVEAARAGDEFVVTCSIGLAQLDPSEEDADELIRRADAALYRAKEAGRDRLATA